jgi:hypothetical protein
LIQLRLERPTVTFAVQASPSFYCIPPTNLVHAFANLNLPRTPPRQYKKRITSINNAHADIVSTCFVYQIQLANHRQLSDVFHVLKQNRHIAAAERNHPTPTIDPAVSITSSFTSLDAALGKSFWPFDVKFQLLRLARNGVISPDQVLDTLPTISLLMANHDVPAIVESLRRLYHSLPPIGPHSVPDDYSVKTITHDLLDHAVKYNDSRSQNPYELLNRHDHIVGENYGKGGIVCW